MRTSAIFGVKTSDFLVCPHRQVKRGVGASADKGGIFRDFVQTYFIDAPFLDTVVIRKIRNYLKYKLLLVPLPRAQIS